MIDLKNLEESPDRCMISWVVSENGLFHPMNTMPFLSVRENWGRESDWPRSSVLRETQNKIRQMQRMLDPFFIDGKDNLCW